MNEKVQNFIEQKNKEVMEAKNKEKEDFLDRYGLYTAVYSEEKPSAYAFTEEEKKEYPFIKWDNGKAIRYKKVYDEITDEEYEAMKKAEEPVLDEHNDEENYSSIAMVLNIMGVVVYLTAFVLGIVLGNQTVSGYYSSHTEFNLGIAVVYWVIGAFSGTILLGFGKIVESLNQQTQLLKKLLKK